MRKIADAAELGRVIRYHRKRARLGRAALSMLAGVGTTVIYELEKGKQTVQWDVVSAVLGTLNIDIHLESPLMNEYVKVQDETG